LDKAAGKGSLEKFAGKKFLDKAVGKSSLDKAVGRGSLDNLFAIYLQFVCSLGQAAFGIKSKGFNLNYLLKVL
jgi:hypothetical protein